MMVIIKWIIFHLFVILTIACKSEGNLGNTDSSPRTYYFDALSGNDQNKGTSPDQAFRNLKSLQGLELKSGNKILLANGSRFKGNLSISAFLGQKGLEISNFQSPTSSSQENPIIDAKGYLSGIYIKNSSNISISNLSITADGGGIVDDTDNATQGMRCGILIHIGLDRVFEKIQIENVKIDKVYYENSGFNRDEDEVTTPNGTQSYGWGIRFLNSSKNGQLNDISVVGCQIRQLSHSGIRFNNTSQKKFKQIEIKNNLVERTGGPGMVLLKCEDAVVSENNISYSGSTNDSRNWGRGSGLWTWGSSKILIDKNTFSYANGPADSAGCHIDFNCNDVIVQRNLSLSNAGGFIEVLGNNFNCAYRYNVSINDGHRVKGEGNNFQEGKIFWLSGFSGKNNPRTGPFNTYIYNNTIFTNADIVTKIAVDKVSNGVLVMNNIFHIEGESQLVLGDQYKPDEGGFRVIENVTFSNNLFFKDNSWPNNVLIQPTYFVVGDAKFRNKQGININDFTPTLKALIKDKGITVPLIEKDSAGLFIGLEIENDILGNPITGLPDLGAIELD